MCTWLINKYILGNQNFISGKCINDMSGLGNVWVVSARVHNTIIEYNLCVWRIIAGLRNDVLPSIVRTLYTISIFLWDQPIVSKLLIPNLIDFRISNGIQFYNNLRLLDKARFHTFPVHVFQNVVNL